MGLVDVNLNFKEIIKELTRIPKWLMGVLIVSIFSGILYFGVYKSYTEKMYSDIARLQTDINLTADRVNSLITPEVYRMDILLLTEKCNTLEEALRYIKSVSDTHMQLLISVMDSKHPGGSETQQLKILLQESNTTYQQYIDRIDRINEHISARQHELLISSKDNRQLK